MTEKVQVVSVALDFSVQDPQQIWSKYSERVYSEDIFHGVTKPQLQKDTAYPELWGKDCQLRHSPGDGDINGVTATVWNIVNSVKYGVKYYTHYKAVCFRASAFIKPHL